MSLNEREFRAAKYAALNIDCLLVLDGYAQFKAEGNLRQFLKETLSLNALPSIELYSYIKPLPLLHSLELVYDQMDYPTSVFTSNKDKTKRLYENTLISVLEEYKDAVTLLALGMTTTQLRSVTIFKYFVNRDWPKVREMYSREIDYINKELAFSIKLVKKKSKITEEQEAAIKQAISELTGKHLESPAKKLIQIALKSKVSLSQLDSVADVLS